MTAAGTAHARRSAIDRADNFGCAGRREERTRYSGERQNTRETRRIDSRTRSSKLCRTAFYPGTFVSGRFRALESGHC